MAGKEKTLPLAGLLEDSAIYPRHSIDSTHVHQLVLAIRAGAQLPPPVVEEATSRIVDGWHRVRAFRRVLGETASIPVELRSYADEAAVLLDAVALNSAHGKKLDRIDQVRVTLLAEAAGVKVDRIAFVLRVPPERVERLRVRVANVPTALLMVEGMAGDPPRMVLKRPVQHLAGTTLTAEQARAQATVPGNSYLLTARQLDDALRLGFIDRTDARLMEALRGLHKRLAEFLK